MQRLKLEKSIQEVTNNDLLALLITTASRDVDRFCTGMRGPESDNYFQTATLTNEVLASWLNRDGDIVTYLHKPALTSVAAFAYKLVFNGSFATVDPVLLETTNGPIVTAHVAAPILPQKVWVQVTYTGGLGSTTAELPQDLIEATTEDAIRIYQENKAGIADAIGSVDTGIMTYTKSMPVRIQRMLIPYHRLRPWREY